MPMTDEEHTWKRCSTCKKPIDYGVNFYACSVSTCNTKRAPLRFCSIECFASHVPEMRHRDAWAEQNRAPTREEWERLRAEELEDADVAAERPAPVPNVAQAANVTNVVRRRIVGDDAKDAELPRDVLIVVSKLKAYVRARSGMNTSDGVADVLSDHLRKLCNEAIRNAARDGRKTLMDRDFRPLV
jgi:hypothetical protein